MAATGRRYAQAAFELAKEQDKVDTWSEDLARAGEVLGDSDVLAFLDAPQVADSVKLDGIGKLLSDVDVLVRNTVNLMTVNRDITKFADMHRLFGEMADALLLASTRVVPKKAEDLGYTFHHPTIDAAFADILKT